VDPKADERDPEGIAAPNPRVRRNGPVACAVAAGKFLAGHSTMKSVERAEAERRRKRREQGLPEQP